METGHSGGAKRYSVDGVHRCNEYVILKAVDQQGKLALITIKASIQRSQDMNEGGRAYTVWVFQLIHLGIMILEIVIIVAALE